jgi:uncharacterized protein YukE
MRIAGDIGDLQRVSGSLTGVVEEMNGSAEALSKRVDLLVGDAGWSGSAAEEFKGAWEQDAAAVIQLGSCVKLAGTVLGTLAAGLEQAQHRLDQAVSDALDAGVPVSADGSVPPGVYAPPVLAAMKQYSTDRAAAEQAAQDARDEASDMLHDLTAAITGEPTSFLKSADVAILAASLKGYYALPNEFAEDAKSKLDAFNRGYKDTQYTRKHTPSGSPEKKALTAELAEMRAERKLLTTDLTAAEKLAGQFKGGHLLGSSLGDIADGLGVLQDGRKTLPGARRRTGRRRGPRRVRHLGAGQGGPREGLGLDARDPGRRRLQRRRDRSRRGHRLHPVRGAVPGAGHVVRGGRLRLRGRPRGTLDRARHRGRLGQGHRRGHRRHR